MPEKLLTIEEVSDALGISVQNLEKLVEKGELPAYKVGGSFLRFRKEQVEAIRNEILSREKVKTPLTPPKRHHKIEHDVAYSQSLLDRVLDFLYFNDFYLISAAIILFAVYYIVKG